MMNFKKTVACHKACTYMVISAVGTAIGMVMAKVIVDRCCCKDKMKNKAKSVIRAMEEKFLD
jgi:deoxyribose-phosphate aldolase